MRQRFRAFNLVWQGIAERLRRPWATVGLFVVLLLGVFEPLTCIIHCTMLDILAANQPTMQHHHVAPDEAVHMVVATAHLCGQASVHFGTPAPNSIHTMPQPFHEMVLLAALLLLPTPAIARSHALAIGPPGQHYPAPLGRPPISY